MDCFLIYPYEIDKVLGEDILRVVFHVLHLAPVNLLGMSRVLGMLEEIEDAVDQDLGDNIVFLAVLLDAVEVADGKHEVVSDLVVGRTSEAFQYPTVDSCAILAHCTEDGHLAL